MTLQDFTSHLCSTHKNGFNNPESINPDPVEYAIYEILL